MVEMFELVVVDKNNKLDGFQLIVDGQQIPIENYYLEFYYKGTRLDEIVVDKVVVYVDNKIVDYQSRDVKINYKHIRLGGIEQFIKDFVYSINDFEDLFNNY